MIGNLEVTRKSSVSPQSPHHRIGEAARLSGVSAANIRYYEKEGLLAAGVRGGNSYRFYSDAEVHRLRFVRLCRAMDMSLDEVRTLLALDVCGAGTDHAACATLDEHLQHVRTRLAELRTLERALLDLRSRCDGTGAQCHVIEALHARADAEPVPPPAAVGRRHV
ncbi:MAG: MerR family transcriptional regulator [Burkholderiales bacterium 66-5]|nr:MAG: MerR family transcriptional regulator [Burkholderiales bacterium 66-5]